MTITAKNVVAQVAVKKSVASGQLGVTSATITPSQFCIFILATKNVSPTTGKTNDHLRTWLVGTSFQLVKLNEYTNAAGGVGQGITMSMWLYPPDRKNSNASGANFFAAYSTTLNVHAFIGYAFECDAGYMVDIMAAGDLASVNSDPGAMSLDATRNMSYMWLYGLGGDTDNASDLTPDNFWTQFAKATTTGGAADSNVAVRGMYKYDYGQIMSANPSLVAADWAATMVTLLEVMDKPILPDNYNLFDDFARANVTQIANGTWGTGGVNVATSDIGITNEQLYQSGASSGQCVTVDTFGPDLDIIVEFRGAVTGTFTIYYSLANPGSSSATGNLFQWLLNFANYGFSTMASGGSTTGFGNTNYDPKPGSGDKLWIAKRGTTHTAYIMRDYTYHWKELCTGVSSTYNRAGPIGIRTSDTSVRLDGIHGINVGTGPVVSTLIDNFNRANGVIGAVAPWDGLTVSQTGSSAVAIASNTVVAGSTLINSIGTSGVYGPDLDLLIDCVTAMPAGNEYFGIYFCLANTNKSTFTGYLLAIDNTTKWQIYRYDPGANVLSPTSSAAVPAAGDTIWIMRRDSAIKVYCRRSGSSTWTLILDILDNTFIRSGKSGLYFYRTGASSAWDNFRGGTVPFQTRIPTLI